MCKSQEMMISDSFLQHCSAYWHQFWESGLLILRPQILWNKIPAVNILENIGPQKQDCQNIPTKLSLLQENTAI
jgi:hypothetical protein